MTTQLILNLLTDPLIRVEPAGSVSLPGLLAQLTRDEVDSYPALRPHQSPAWHMFVVQLAALALHKAGKNELPVEEEGWLVALRSLTPAFPADEPWCLVVADAEKPAFMQPPVPAGVSVTGSVPSPDALDVLITSRNHDLKQSVGTDPKSEDWIFSLVSLQTMEGFSGQKNYGIARMNGGSSSRAMLGLAPLSSTGGKDLCCRSGRWFRRDVEVMLNTRTDQLNAWSHLGYLVSGGIGLTWIERLAGRKADSLGRSGHMVH